ncbi:MAG: TfuA-like protein [Anaeromyxobacteraceae bacterium]
MKRTDLVVVLGPSLPAREAARLARCTVLPPARQGDVWRALALRPRAIALVDGVFESVPSVWHHELLDALDGGVAVFGGASMGALRAAELSAQGMVGVGRIYRWYRDGVLHDDAEVALLHADAELGFRPLTLPLVTVRHAAQVAREEGLLAPREARALVAEAASIPYTRRTWRGVLAAAAPRLGPSARARLEAFVARGPPDPKAEDARATIAAAAAFAASGAPALPGRAARRPPSHVRRRKLGDCRSVAGGAGVAGAEVLASLRRRPDAPALEDAGMRRALLAGFARALGLAASSDAAARAAEAWRGELGLTRAGFARHLAACGLDPADAARLFDDLALERLLLDAAARAVPDGPSPDEGLALGARLGGAWAEEARRAAVRYARRHAQARPRRR